MAASPASATCSPDTRRPTGSARGAGGSPHARGPMASSNSRRLASSTGWPISCRHRGCTGIAITGCSPRITSSGPPSRRSPSGMSASGKRPRRAGMRATGTPRKAAATRIKSPARTTPHRLPGPSCLRGLPRRFHWCALPVAVTSGSLLSSPTRGRSEKYSRTSASRWNRHPDHPPEDRPPSGPSSFRPHDDRDVMQAAPDELPVIDIHSL